jgi:hypothetical protein
MGKGATLGRLRSSSGSRDNLRRAGHRHRLRVRARGPRGRGATDFSESSQERNNIVVLLLEGGLRYHDKGIASGAQTERRGEAGPVRVLLGGGHAPAALFQSLLTM